MTKSTYLGKCMYCGQQAMLEINDDIVTSYEDNLCLFLLFGSRRIYRQKSYVANKKNQNRQKSKETIHGYGIGTIAELYRKY